MVDLLFRQKKCLERKEDKVRVVAWPEYDSLDYGRLWGGDYEIGLLRFSQQVIPLLIEQKRWVSQKFLEKLARQIASYEFGVSSSEPNNPLAILEGKVKFGLAPPHKDHIYRQKIKDGDL